MVEDFGRRLQSVKTDSRVESCTGMGITVFPRLLRGNGDRVNGNTAGMGTTSR